MTTSQPEKVSLPLVLPQITKAWSPKLLANLNGEYDVKIAKLRGEFVFHAHPDTDELFYNVSGTLLMRLCEDDNAVGHGLQDIVLEEGDMLNIPRGMRHCPVAETEGEVVVIIIEKVGTINTGDVEKVDGLTNEVEDIRSE